MTDLETRTDIDALLRAFYTRVFGDPLLAHVFVDVAHMDLEEHLPKIGDFWEKVLLNTAEYDGQALEVHRRLHRIEPLTSAHFHRWLQLWDQVLEQRYDGPVAKQASSHAARIAAAFQRNLHVDEAGSRTEFPIRPADRPGPPPQMR